MSVASCCCKSVCVVPCVIFCTGHFVMVPLNMTHLHCLQHSLFEHLFNLYFELEGLQKLFNMFVHLYCPQIRNAWRYKTHKLCYHNKEIHFKQQLRKYWINLRFMLENNECHLKPSKLYNALLTCRTKLLESCIIIQ